MSKLKTCFSRWCNGIAVLKQQGKWFRYECSFCHTSENYYLNEQDAYDEWQSIPRLPKLYGVYPIPVTIVGAKVEDRNGGL